MKPVLIISGTNRPGSNAMKIATVLAGHYRRAEVPVDLLSLVDLPEAIYRPEAYAQKPLGFVAIQQRVLAASGLHVVSPEYTGSFPGVLKYFLDMLKYPDSFHRKPVAFVGEASGVWGGLRAVEQLQLVFAYRNAHVYPERVFISAVEQKLDSAGLLVDAEIDARLRRQAEGFAGFIGCIGQVAP